MFGKRCSLCGGRLNQYNVCMECGLDNTKSDKNYNLRKNKEDNTSLTHEHTGPVNHSWDKKTTQKVSRKTRPDPYQTVPGRASYPTTTANKPYQAPSTRKSQSGAGMGNLIVWVIRIIVIMGIMSSIFSAMLD